MKYLLALIIVCVLSLSARAANFWDYPGGNFFDYNSGANNFWDYSGGNFFDSTPPIPEGTPPLTNSPSLSNSLGL